MKNALPTTTDGWVALARAHGAALYNPPDVVVVRGDGAWLQTLDGVRLLDCAGGMGVSLLGHNHPRIARALREQAEQLLHTSNALLTRAPIALAARLAELTGGYQSFFVNSGTEATEGALKLARALARTRGRARSVFVACSRGFHGRTFGALSVTGQPKMHDGFVPLLPTVRFVPFDDIPALQAAMDQEVAAVVVEPIQGNGGVRVPAPDYLANVQGLCREHGALWIADEVQTGIGRTGEMFASLHKNVRPDILCLAKALGGGLPLGAVLAPPELMGALGPGSHGSTFGGNPLSCAVGLAVLDAIAEEHLLARARALEATVRPKLAALPGVQEVRGKGLLLGVVLQSGLCAGDVRARALRHGLLVTVAGEDVVRLFLPAVLRDEEVVLLIQRLGAALGEAVGAP